MIHPVDAALTKTHVAYETKMLVFLTEKHLFPPKIGFILDDFGSMIFFLHGVVLRVGLTPCYSHMHIISFFDFVQNT